MDPDYLLFARVAEAGSLSAAGRMLGISPTMMSRRLAKLEARLGVRLVHRSTRRMALTEAGTRFHADLAGILDALRDAEARLTGIGDEPAGLLRVSAPTSFGRLHVAPHLHGFLAEHPRIRLELDLTDANVDLFAGRTDLAIRIAGAIPASLTAHRLGSSRRLLCASPDYLARHGMPETLAALARHRLLAAEGQLPWRLERGRQRHSVEGISHVRTNSSEVVRELVLTGVGIALRSLWDVHAAVADGRLQVVMPGWEGPRDLGVHALHPRAQAVPPAVAAFVGFLQRSLRPSPWE